MRKIKFLFILLLVFVGMDLVSAESEIDTSIKVYDYADILTSSEEEELQLLANKYIDKYNMDMVLVTVKEHNKIDTKEYAQDFYDYNGFGIGDTNDGLIFVIDLSFGYTDIYIATTGEAIRVYDDYRINSMLDNIAFYKDFGYYDMFESFINDSDKFAMMGVAESNINTVIDKFGNLVRKKRIHWIPITIISLIVSGIVLLIFIFKNRMVKKSINATYYLDEGSVNINVRKDRYITSHTTSVRINNSSSSGGIGGSSISRGSSGISHGGGGRRL